MCAGVSTTSLIIFGVQPSTPTSTRLAGEASGPSPKSTADVVLFSAPTSSAGRLVLRRGRDGVSRACMNDLPAA
jgi:hypothetical protein